MGEKQRTHEPARYNAYMYRLLAPLLLLLLVCPLAASAAGLPLIDPSWHIVPDAHELDASCPEGAPLGLGGVLQTIQNVMNAGITLGVLISVLVIAFAGILWMLTSANPENHSQAKKVLTNAVVGLLIILSAWLIVDFVMKILYSGPAGQQGKFGPWNEILTGGEICVDAMDTKPLFTGDFFTVPGDRTGDPPAGGSCTIPTDQQNPCSVTKLSSTCFGSRANDASRICMKESAGGQVAIRSGSDKLDGGSGPSYSWGLWQINLTVHHVGGLDCPSAFTCRCEKPNLVGPSKPGACNCSLKKTQAAQDMYASCVAAAQDPVKNTSVACSLYTKSDANGGFQSWAYSANECGVAKH